MRLLTESLLELHADRYECKGLFFKNPKSVHAVIYVVNEVYMEPELMLTSWGLLLTFNQNFAELFNLYLMFPYKFGRLHSLK